MPTIYKEVEVDYDVEDFTDDELVEEIESRGFRVLAEDEDIFADDETIQEAIWRYKNGYIEDTLLLIERKFPELYGLHKRIKT
jgi:hypothetical protein